jgi:hypothetical protein
LSSIYITIASSETRNQLFDKVIPHLAELRLVGPLVRIKDLIIQAEVFELAMDASDIHHLIQLIVNGELLIIDYRNYLFGHKNVVFWLQEQ